MRPEPLCCFLAWNALALLLRWPCYVCTICLCPATSSACSCLESFTFPLPFYHTECKSTSTGTVGQLFQLLTIGK